MTKYSQWLRFLVIVPALLILAGCGRSGPEPTATPTKTPDAGEVAAAPTATPVPAQQETQPQTGAQQDAAPAESAAEPAATPVPAPDRATITATQLNIRSEPSTTGSIVRLVDQGAQFEVVSVSDDGQWVELGENGQPVGWAAAEFVSVDGGAVAGSDSAEQPDQAAPPAQPCAARISAARPSFGGARRWPTATWT